MGDLCCLDDVLGRYPELLVKSMYTRRQQKVNVLVMPAETQAQRQSGSFDVLEDEFHAEFLTIPGVPPAPSLISELVGGHCRARYSGFGQVRSLHC